MTAKTIEVDDEVYEFLRVHAIPFEDKTPNDVLRRLLLGAGPSPSTGRPGRLAQLIAAGTLIAGDKLVHEQPRKRLRYTAAVTPDGHVQLEDGRRFAAPSPALEACVGSSINGWANWVVERTGQPLGDLRV
jgi:hypothetical protein